MYHNLLLTPLQSDGPVALAAAMDSYRQNHYNISGPSNITNRLIQGAFRYQRLNLSTPGELVLAKLPGTFECSDGRLTQIWQVGARTIQLNEIPALSIPDFWQVFPEGSLVESQAPQALSASGAAGLLAYEIDFEVKSITGGFSFSVLTSTLNEGVYIWCNIANGSVTANGGSTEFGTPVLAYASLPSNVTMGDWHRVKANVTSAGISVYLDGSVVLQFSQTYSFYGSFGLGAAQRQSAMFRNLIATSPEGETIYASRLNDTSFLADFTMGTNPLNTTVDGSKRDRIAYAGDLDVALGSTMVSTYGVEYIQGTLDLIGSLQLQPGFFVPTAKIQQGPNPSGLVPSNLTGLIGYSFNLVTAAANFYQQTGDLNLAAEWAPKIVLMLDWADSQSVNGLFNLSEASFGGDWNYYDPPQSGIVAKFNMVYAYALQSSLTLLADAGADAAKYSSRLNALRLALNNNLWSNDLKAYYLSRALPNGFGQDSNALAILAGVTNANHTTSQVLTTLSKLYTARGPLAFSSEIVAAGFRNYISPYASAYHLRAALSTGDADTAKELLSSLWYPMADPTGANFTNCFWETLNAEGAPALGPSTSLCHAWGAGATGELSTYVLGIQPITPGFRDWAISPVTLGLDWAAGNIPVPGGEISVAWNATDDVITSFSGESPSGTSGTIMLPNAREDSVYKVEGNVEDCGNGKYTVSGGSFSIILSKS
jgi:hypothetical protein